VFEFIQRMEKCSFKVAFEKAARMAGVDLNIKLRSKTSGKSPGKSFEIYQDFFSLLELGRMGHSYLIDNRGLADRTLVGAHIVSIESQSSICRTESHC